MSQIKVYGHTFHDACLMAVKVGTNCPQGGASSHGGRTILKLSNAGSACMAIHSKGGSASSVQEVEIVFGGDSEARGLLEVLEFAANILRNQLAGNSPEGACEVQDCDETFRIPVSASH